MILLRERTKLLPKISRQRYMTTHAKKKGPYKSTHRIAYINYATDTLQCICGWIGRAYDQTPNSENYILELDWINHKKKSPPVEKAIQDLYKGPSPYNTMTIRPAKEKVVA